MSTLEPTLAPSSRQPPERPRSRPRRRWFDVGPRAYKLLWDGHSVTGVFTGLGLFVIFFCGALALYREELREWADPALRGNPAVDASIDAMVAPVLEEHPPAHGEAFLLVWPFRERAYYYLAYEAASGEEITRRIAAASGEVLPAASRSILPDLLNDLHYFGQLGRPGQIVSGLLGIALFFTIVTGVVVHLRKLPQDLHTFRPRAKLRVALADLHTVLGTIGVPFSAVFAVTGAYFSLLFVVFGALVIGALGGEPEKLGSFVPGIERPPYEASGVAAPPLPLDTLLARLPSDWPPIDLVAMEIEGWGDAAGTVFMEGSVPGTFSQTGAALLNVSTGEILTRRDPEDTPPMTATAVGFVTLHFAELGGAALKALFFLLALSTSAVILTGNLLWIEVRRPANPAATPWLHRILTRLTAGLGAGLVAAVPLLFLVTRLIPIDAPGRTADEQLAFFSLWGLLTASALFVPDALKFVRWTLAGAGTLALIVPLTNGLGTGAWPWLSAARQDWTVFSTDIAFLLAGALLLAITKRAWPRSASR